MIRTNTLIWWFSNSATEVSSRMAPSWQERKLEDMKVGMKMVEVVSQAEQEMDNSTKAALGHIASYWACLATRGKKCGACADMVNREAALMESGLKRTRASRWRPSTGAVGLRQALGPVFLCH